MTHVVKIDILTGHEEMGNLHFILKIILIAYLSKGFFQNLYSKSWNIAYCLAKFC